MFRNQYDTSVTTFSPAGRLFQVEYACEAVKQGAVTLGLVSDKAAVLACLRLPESDLATPQEKIYKIDSHVAVAVCGLIPDGGDEIDYLRQQAGKHRYIYNSGISIRPLVSSIADKNQKSIQESEKRPVGVGLLVIGRDDKGLHLFETNPTADFNEYIAYAIGSRSQSAITYLEKNLDDIKKSTIDELLVHAIKAIKQSYQETLTYDKISISYIEIGSKPLVSLSQEKLTNLIDTVGANADDDDDDDILMN